MTTPNNAAALERLEQKWREDAGVAEIYALEADSIGLHDAGKSSEKRAKLLNECADELAKIRAGLTQTDALTSQPSGEAGHMPPNVVLALDYSRNFANAKPDIGSTEREHIIGLCGLLERAYTHPSADARGVAVDEWRPIESAPAGVPILVRYVNRAGKERVIKARFIQRFTEESSNDCDEGVDEYDEANDRYTYCEGWWEMIDNWDDFAFVAVSEGSPTHWHKIPSTAALAPKPEGGSHD